MKSEEEWPTTGQAPKTLTWHGEGLADWVSGYTWYPNGPHDGGPQYPFPDVYNAAAVSPSGRYQVIYDEYGIDGLLLDWGEPLRALTRDDDDPGAFLFPVTFATLPDGREVVISCPEDRSKLEVQLASTGESITTRDGEADDYFHSRLAVSPGNRWLLSAGWIWHPFIIPVVFDLELALTDPSSLDTVSALPRELFWSDAESACWLDDDRIAFCAEPGTSAGGFESWHLCKGELGVWSMKAAAWESKVPVEGHLGTIHRFGKYLMSLHEHPKLIDPATGAVVEAWPHLATGDRTHGVGWSLSPQPAVAVHPDGTRFAVASDEAITIVTWTD